MDEIPAIDPSASIDRFKHRKNDRPSGSHIIPENPRLAKDEKPAPLDRDQRDAFLAIQKAKVQAELDKQKIEAQATTEIAQKQLQARIEVAKVKAAQRDKASARVSKRMAAKQSLDAEMREAALALKAEQQRLAAEEKAKAKRSVYMPMNVDLGGLEESQFGAKNAKQEVRIACAKLAGASIGVIKRIAEGGETDNGEVITATLQMQAIGMLMKYGVGEEQHVILDNMQAIMAVVMIAGKWMSRYNMPEEGLEGFREETKTVLAAYG